MANIFKSKYTGEQVEQLLDKINGLEINPVGEPTSIINTIKINNVIYSFNGSSVSKITFIIDDVQYTADSNMSWEQWIGSDYNTINAVKYNNYIQSAEGKILQIDGNYCLITDIIINNGSYEWKDEVIEKITFTIDDVQYTADSNMSWEQWVNSDYNTAGATIYDDFIQDENGGFLKRDDVAFCYKSDIIINNHNYSWNVLVDSYIGEWVFNDVLSADGLPYPIYNADNEFQSWDEFMGPPPLEFSKVYKGEVNAEVYEEVNNYFIDAIVFRATTITNENRRGEGNCLSFRTLDGEYTIAYYLFAVNPNLAGQLPTDAKNLWSDYAYLPLTIYINDEPTDLIIKNWILFNATKRE